MRTGGLGYMHITASFAPLLLTGCFGTPAATDLVVAPLNAVAAGACTGSDADAAEPKARETVCLQELGQRASRKGNVLSLKLDDGTTKAFRSDPEACKRDDAERCGKYRLIGFHAASGHYVVHGQGYDDYDVRLVSARTGKATKLVDVPHFSPDGSTFVTARCDELACSISLGSIASDPAAIVWGKKDRELHGRGWKFLRWIDDDQAALRGTAHTEGCAGTACEAILKRVGSSWTIENLPAK